MLWEYGQVNKIDKITFTSLRRGLEAKVQSNHAMKTRSQDVNNHKLKTGADFYDRSKSDFRSVAMNYVNTGEGSAEAAYEPDDVDDEVANKRAKLDDAEKEESVNEAKKKIQTKARKTRITSRCHLLAEHRTLIQEMFSQGGKHEDALAGHETFPGK